MIAILIISILIFLYLICSFYFDIYVKEYIKKMNKDDIKIFICLKASCNNCKNSSFEKEDVVWCNLRQEQIRMSNNSICGFYEKAFGNDVDEVE